MNWKCDTCGEHVSADEGCVQWLTIDATERKATFRREKFQIVHNNARCRFDKHRLPPGSTDGDLEIKSFLGQDGLVLLLQYISDEPQAVDELVELSKRLQIDGYDEARGWFKGAIAEGVFEHGRKPGFYDASEIQKTLEWARTAKTR